jgi:hypothetical protein
MDLLGAAVIDITTLVATCHALAAGPADGDLALQRKRRQRLRRQIKRGTVAYIDALARTKRGVVNEVLLAACRVAAERQMAAAIRHQDLLRRIMAGEPGSLDGLAAARQDLWRLAHMTIYLRIGMAALLEAGDPAARKSAGAASARLRRRLRKALIAYARASLRPGQPRGQLIAAARAAAIAEIGRPATADAEHLAAIEAGSGDRQTILRLGLVKPLIDLFLDWHTGRPAPV